MCGKPTEKQLCVRVMAARVCAVCKLGMNMPLGRVGARHAVPLRCNCRPAPQSSGQASSLVPAKEAWLRNLTEYRSNGDERPPVPTEIQA